ncbi:hypothetical protein GDO86_012240 [Hymenochirus boettgeri]|uniref:Ig-like domain-containing protein n=1 Tax=Hymenochirus boettgeri TaxID=247094 RepID=A0A8T2ILI0_9PIPI|nr:hypothetical protein GDO86_012240 [Hymenochirus boettgeri]
MKFVTFLTVVSVLCYDKAHGDSPAIWISGPEYPILEGEDVTLECVSNIDSDMKDFTFQKYSKWMEKWFELDTSRYFRCWYYNVNISRESGRLLLQLNDISEWQKGPYRCVASGDNFTEAAVSHNFTVPVYYLHDVYIQSLSAWSITVGDELLVEEGSDVELKCSASCSHKPAYEWTAELSDWIYPSDTLLLKNVDPSQSGKYTCMAFHPDMPVLLKTKTFQLQVVPKSSRYVYGGLGLGEMLIYFVAPAVTLILLLLTTVVIVNRHRRRQLRKPQISLIDAEKRTPIYKGSSHSVNSTQSDTQPLVM